MSYDPSGYPQQPQRPQRPPGQVYGRPYPGRPGPPAVPMPPAQPYGLVEQAQLRAGEQPMSWQPPPPAPTPGPRPRRWPYLVLVLVLLVAAGGAWTAYAKNLIFKDSGIEACESLRDGSKTFRGDAQSNEKMTEPRYRELRKVFEDSRYDDIRDHGTKLMDVVWSMSQAMDAGGGSDSDASAGAALMYLQPLSEHLTGLQSACADQGIIVNLTQKK